MKTLTIGTELEFTGIGRREAAETVAKYFGTLEPVEVTAAIHLSAALIAFAKRAKKALYRPVNLDNAKFAMRTFLTRPQGLNLNGADYAMTRHVLTKNLEGNGAWRFAC